MLTRPSLHFAATTATAAPCFHRLFWSTTRSSSTTASSTFSLASPEKLQEYRDYLRPLRNAAADDTVTIQLARDYQAPHQEAMPSVDEWEHMSPQQIEQCTSRWQRLGTTTALITLHNASSRNALTGHMMAQLADIVDDLQLQVQQQQQQQQQQPTITSDDKPQDENDETATTVPPPSVIVVQGAGDFFCAGADLGVAAQHLQTKYGGTAMSCVMIDALTRLQQLPVVTVALIRGGAVGGGAELCTAMDYRFLYDTAVIRFIHARMGLTPGWGGTTRLVRLVGHAHALRLLGTALPHSAALCQAMGLVDQVIPRGKITRQKKPRRKLSMTPLDQGLSASFNPMYFANDDAMDKAAVQWITPFVQGQLSTVDEDGEDNNNNSALHSTVLQSVKRAVLSVNDNDDDHAGDDIFPSSLAREQAIFLQLWGGPVNRAAVAASRATKSMERDQVQDLPRASVPKKKTKAKKKKRRPTNALVYS